jgi:ribose transport system substrate-binding protein
VSTAAAEQIREMGLSGEVKLVGFDNSPEELEWLQEGVIQATVIQNPFSIGYLGVKTAAEAADRQHVEKRIDTGTKVIDAVNMFWSDNQKMLFPFVQ